MLKKPLLQKISGHNGIKNAGRKLFPCILYFPLWLSRPSDLAVGGQAVIEGVMMRGYQGYAIAVRQQNGKVAVKREKKIPLIRRFKLLGAPVLRGIIVLFEALVIGIKALEYSANAAVEEKPVESSTDEAVPQIGKTTMFFIFLSSMVIGILLFVVVPNLTTQWSGIDEISRPITFHLIAGIIRIIIFMGYIIGISYMKDIKRVFEYHGAEHKTIHTYEADEDLTVSNAHRKSRLHPRCGTSFILTVMIVSIFAFAVVPGILIYIFPEFSQMSIWIQKMILIPLHIVMVLPIAGISYEINRRCAKSIDSPITKILVSPGLALQRITTREPDGPELEVAIMALNKTLELGEV